MRSVAILLLFTLVARAEPIVPIRATNGLASLARDLAGKGCAKEANVLQEVLRTLGQSEKDAKRLADACARRSAKAKKRAKNLSSTVKSLERMVAYLANLLAQSEEDPRQSIAGAILRLDATNIAAHEALGHERIGGVWLPAKDVPIWKRRAEIELAVQRARRLTVDVERVDAGHPYLETIEGSAGVGARATGIEIFSRKLQPALIDRLVRETNRARAVSGFVRGRGLEVPASNMPATFVVMKDKPSYLRCIEHAARTGALAARNAAVARRVGAMILDNGSTVVCMALPENQLKSLMLMTGWLIWSHDEYGSAVQACLTAGHMGWVCARYHGVDLAKHNSVETEDRGRDGATRARPNPKNEDAWKLHLGKTGIRGSRAWLRHLVQRGEDPAWRESMVDLLANIGGTNRMKSIFVAEYLQETDSLDSIIRNSMERDSAPRIVLRDALGKPLGDFEQEWRAWLLGQSSEAGVLQTLGGSSTKSTVDPTATVALRHLARIRSAVPELKSDLWLDPELSAGALAHCRYLHLHPDQAAKWPDVHEEYADKKGFSIEGHWAGTHSVIVSGVESPTEALDCWMGTFYHRLPLLDPGLIGIGWAQDGDTATLDVSTLVLPWGSARWVGWPAPGMKSVPLRFAAGEMPHPVPGEDQTTWGYPITLQLFGYKKHSEIEMQLLMDGKTAVACHYSTPDRPTNPELAPIDAFCLIPKRHLSPKTKYTVVARNLPDGSSARWTFRTR